MKRKIVNVILERNDTKLIFYLFFFQEKKEEKLLNKKLR